MDTFKSIEVIEVTEVEQVRQDVTVGVEYLRLQMYVCLYVTAVQP